MAAPGFFILLLLLFTSVLIFFCCCWAKKRAHDAIYLDGQFYIELKHKMLSIIIVELFLECTELTRLVPFQVKHLLKEFSTCFFVYVLHQMFHNKCKHITKCNHFFHLFLPVAASFNCSKYTIWIWRSITFYQHAPHHTIHSRLTNFGHWQHSENSIFNPFASPCI